MKQEGVHIDSTNGSTSQVYLFVTACSDVCGSKFWNANFYFSVSNPSVLDGMYRRRTVHVVR